MRIATVIGARPQFIKAAPVSAAFAAAGIAETLVHTGQHFDAEMSEIFFRELKIPAPRHNLGLGGGEHGQMTGRMLEAIEELLLADRPEWVLVYGDTNSTLAGALAAAKLHIPVCHVEAGLRSYNRRMPEEINRVLTDHVARKLFCSSEEGVRNLAAEGIREGVEVVGDVMADASRLARSLTKGREAEFLTSLEADDLEDGFVLLTLHRAENTDDAERLRGLVREFNRFDRPVVFPVHPRTKQALERVGVTLETHIKTVPPVGYLEMSALLSRATLVLTDSGGLQKEAYWAKVPCLTLRPETEWVETVERGWNVLLGDDPAELSARLATLVPADWVPLYGEGDSAQKIAASLVD